MTACAEADRSSSVPHDSGCSGCVALDDSDSACLYLPAFHRLLCLLPVKMTLPEAKTGAQEWEPGRHAALWTHRQRATTQARQTQGFSLNAPPIDFVADT